MSIHRTKALNTVKYLRMAPSAIQGLKREKRLVIEAPQPWPPEWVAQYVLRVALENGCTKIKVTQGVHTVREFDVMQLVTLTRSMTGGHLPRPRMTLVPAWLATMSHRAMGNRLDPTYGESRIAVPSNLVLSTSTVGTQGESNGE